MAGRVCTQCGGPLEPGSAVCPWCQTPVSVPTRVVVERVNPSDPELDDDTDDEPDNTRLVVGGGLAFTMATVFFVISASAYSSCSSGGSCDTGTEVGSAVAGLWMLAVGLGVVVWWLRSRPDRGGF